MKSIMDVRLKRGVRIPLQFRLIQSGVPIVLTDVLLSASVKTSRGVLVGKLAVTSPDAEDGLIQVYPPDTEDWPIGVHRWDIDLVFPSGDKLSLPIDEPASWEVVEDTTRSTD